MCQLDETIEGDNDEYKNASEKLSAIAKVMLVTNKAVFGPGPVKLLYHINETGSVSEACAAMNLSYSKGWQLLNNMEDGLGFKVIKRFHGGAGGGKSELTAKGMYLMQKYEELRLDTQEYLDKLFEEVFADLDQLKEFDE
ncbi:MAG: LysR family transcriptional regulator [Eubacteriales bacterium]|nr:LysR family transcriptional regulator [Eubacteriales bacterium]MDD4323741.1 LysR family transcriptional regulator [Eubacteriales bacterium]MDD4541113.1 LysR family transcriptional regulator [Eubacteriales bacterium]